MSEDEHLIMMVALFGGLAAAFALSTSRLHELFTRGNSGIGMHRMVSLSALADLDLKDGQFKKVGYLLAAGGGFGATVPHPSSGG